MAKNPYNKPKISKKTGKIILERDSFNIRLAKFYPSLYQIKKK